MRATGLFLLVGLTTLVLPIACVDLLEIPMQQRVNVIVVDGTLTNLSEAQVIRINRSKSDSLTGRFGSLPITKAQVEVVIDSSQVIVFAETDTAGTYRSPAGFKTLPGSTYQLRFTLLDGSQYRSTTEIMPLAVPINQVHTQFNPTSLPAILDDGGINQYRGAHEITVDFQDPTNQHNYYRWDWILWEKQDWCRSCVQGYYLIYQPSDDITPPPPRYEACMEDYGATHGGTNTGVNYFVNDYNCRTQCWEIIRSFTTNVFDDIYSNGGLIRGRSVAQIPYFQMNACLVQLRQSTLTKGAYQYYKTVEEQTQNTGGVAATPPTALVGNLRNVTNEKESVIGYFTVSAVSPVLIWIDRRDATGRPPGLFAALNGRPPSPETGPVGSMFGQLNSSRVPTALCVPSDSRTPNKPIGWRD